MKWQKIYKSWNLPNPSYTFFNQTREPESGIMISASHNPPEYNGIKIFDHNGQKITKNLKIKFKN